MLDVDVVAVSVVALALSIAVGAAAFLAWSLATFRQPRALVRDGDFRAAALAAERLGASWMRVFPGVRDEAAYARAACLHLEGRFDDSLDALATLGPRRALAESVALLEGANLVMLERDPERAALRLELACASSRPSPEDLLFLALAKLAVGDRSGAQALFARVGTSRPKDAPSPRIYEAAFHYLRGLYLLETAGPREAASDLLSATAAPVSTIYVERARALAPIARDDADNRTSLMPQVIDE